MPYQFIYTVTLGYKTSKTYKESEARQMIQDLARLIKVLADMGIALDVEIKGEWKEAKA